MNNRKIAAESHALTMAIQTALYNNREQLKGASHYEQYQFIEKLMSEISTKTEHFKQMMDDTMTQAEDME